MNNIRAFIAVEVSNTIGIEKLQQELVSDTGWRCDQARPVKSHNLHFTLIFLGDVGLESINKIKNKLSELQFEPITITFTGIGGFPNSNFARVVWVGVDADGCQKLASLADQVVLKLSELGFRLDKPFSPHLTIFRINGGNLKLRTELLYKYGKKDFGSDVGDKVHLKRSDLTPSGPIYTNIFTVNAI
ncbi:MAG: RNA 2',3'-cyclic phosphodiesterase [Candidatus Nitrosopolaris sp.]